MYGDLPLTQGDLRPKSGFGRNSTEKPKKTETRTTPSYVEFQDESAGMRFVWPKQQKGICDDFLFSELGT